MTGGWPPAVRMSGPGRPPRRLDRLRRDDRRVREGRGKLNLKAHNLQLFIQIADGVDDDTWLFHLHNDDVANWLRAEVKDPCLAAEVDAIARTRLEAADSRAAVRRAIERRYTLPADKPSGVVDTPPLFVQSR
jgi:hypothetical protein